MIGPLWDLLAAYLVGVMFGWLMQRGSISVLREQLHDARQAEALATDRLLHAWKDGATIPPRPVELPPPPGPLPAELLEEINQWEDPEHRAMLEARFRAELATGKGVPAILLALDNEHP